MASIDFTPPPRVRDFIKFFAPGELFRTYIVGPFGSGKTTGNFFKAIYLAGLQQPSPVDGIRYVRVVVVRNTAPQLRDTTIPSFFTWFKDGEAGQWKATDRKFTMRYNDVHIEWLFRGLDTADDVKNVLSLETTFAVLDEFVEIPQAIVDALEARCGRYPSKKDGGATNWGLWGASNPGNEDNWWFKFLEEDHKPNLPSGPTAYFKQPSGFSPEAENIENLPGGVDYYTSLAKNKSEAWISQFIKSEWGFSQAGLPVITTFSPDLHVAKMGLIPNKLLPLVGGFDPGMRSAMIFGQLDLQGRLYVYDELVQRDFGAERFITDRLRPLLRNRFPDFEFIVSPDPASNQRTPTNESTVVKTFKSKGYVVRLPDDNNRLPPRIEAIEHYTTRLVEGKPALLIDPRCKNLIRALRGGWRYGQANTGTETPEPVKNDHSHPADAFSYLCKYTAKNAGREAKRKEVRRQGVLANPYALR